NQRSRSVDCDRDHSARGRTTWRHRRAGGCDERRKNRHDRPNTAPTRKLMGVRSSLVPIALILLAAGCRQPVEPRPSILLVTLDTTRADAIGPGTNGIDTPAFNALASRGRLFRQAYATVPETLPSHSSMMTGLYPAGHGVHENARYL